MAYQYHTVLGQVLQADSGGGEGFFLIFVVVFLLFLALWGYGTYWIYNDAKDRGGNAAIWTVAMVAGGFLFGIFAVGVVALAWVLVRPDATQGSGGSDGTTHGGTGPDSGTDSDNTASSWDVDDDGSSSDDSSGVWDDQ